MSPWPAASGPLFLQFAQLAKDFNFDLDLSDELYYGGESDLIGGGEDERFEMSETAKRDPVSSVSETIRQNLRLEEVRAWYLALIDPLPAVRRCTGKVEFLAVASELGAI